MLEISLIIFGARYIPLAFCLFSLECKWFRYLSLVGKRHMKLMNICGWTIWATRNLEQKLCLQNQIFGYNLNVYLYLEIYVYLAGDICLALAGDVYLLLEIYISCWRYISLAGNISSRMIFTARYIPLGFGFFSMQIVRK